MPYKMHTGGEYPEYRDTLEDVVEKLAPELGPSNEVADKFVSYMTEAAAADPRDFAEQLLGMLAEYDENLLEEEFAWYLESL